MILREGLRNEGGVVGAESAVSMLVPYVSRDHGQKLHGPWRASQSASHEVATPSFMNSTISDYILHMYPRLH